MQVGIIRQVEVDLDAKLEQQRSALKSESNTLRQWRKKAEEYAAQVAERDGEWCGEGSMGGMGCWVAWGGSAWCMALAGVVLAVGNARTTSRCQRAQDGEVD